MNHPSSPSFRRSLIVVILAGFAAAPAVDAAGRGGGGGGRQVDSSKADARSNNVRATSANNVNQNSANRNSNVNNNTNNNVNRNTNVNKNVNVNVSGNGNGNGNCCNNGWDNDYHPIATAAAVTATVAVIGSIVRTPPSNCAPVNYGGMMYQQCGSTWYQPQGSQYVVVNPPY